MHFYRNRDSLAPKIVVVCFLIALAHGAMHGQTVPLPLSRTDAWPTYGGSPGGTRYSTAGQITRENLDKLRPAWTFHTNPDGVDPGRNVLPSLETTPVLSGDTLYLTSPFDIVFAVDARTGKERWRFDPKLPPQHAGDLVASRGVALWPLGTTVSASAPTCSSRVFAGTLDGRLLALDAASGHPCEDFGEHGSVDLTRDVGYTHVGTYGLTSPPTVVGNVVVVGSLVSDNQQVDIESGAVRGYDALTGKRLWKWEPLPWAQQQSVRTGAGNTWSIISADPELGLVFLPTGSAAPDFFGGLRVGDNRDANSVVALDAATGRKVWSFQVVHHDVWDYDVASEPVLFTWRGTIPAVAVTTKMGMIFLLNRLTGQPLVPVQERRVAQDGAPGEQLSPTQPFQDIPPLSPLQMGAISNALYKRSSADEAFCRKQLAELRNEGIYTPPSLEGSVLFPGNVGGVNWGGAAVDPVTGVLYANTNRKAFVVRLIPRHGERMLGRAVSPFVFSRKLWLALLLLSLIISFRRTRSFRPSASFWIVLCICVLTFGGRAIYNWAHPTPHVPQLDHFGLEFGPQRKTPYIVERYPLVDRQGLPCSPAPWGAITAVNLNSLSKVWEVPLGSSVPDRQTGALNFGGPIVTASGLVFTAGAEDPWLRAFDAASGTELQRFALPLPGQATPMTYTLDGKQYIVVAAGGHGDGYGAFGDEVVAFSLP